jgi:hypothetical protein
MTVDAVQAMLQPTLLPFALEWLQQNAATDSFATSFEGPDPGTAETAQECAEIVARRRQFCDDVTNLEAGTFSAMVGAMLAFATGSVIGIPLAIVIGAASAIGFLAFQISRTHECLQRQFDDQRACDQKFAAPAPAPAA